MQFGRYFLEEQLATGGMAEIFRAKLLGVEGFEKIVALKRILPFWSGRPDFIAMLVDEAKVLVHLNHPNIVQVFELGRVERTYFIAMEFVEGMDLRHLLQSLRQQNKVLEPELAVGVLCETLKGLHYAHTRELKGTGPLKIVHRDISPQNILLSEWGEVKVSDFGIAKAMTQTHETQTGMLKGKYAYMSPEQAMGTDLDARSDLFACGLVLYELLMGRKAFPGKSDLQILDQVRRVDIVWPEVSDLNFSAALLEVLRRSLALDRRERFANAQEFCRALEACPERAPVDFAQRLGKYVQQYRPSIQSSAVNSGITAAAGEPRGSTQFHSHEVGEGTVSVVETGRREVTLGPVPLSAQALSEASPRNVRRFLPLILGALWLALAGGLTYLTVQNFFADSPVVERSKFFQSISETFQVLSPLSSSSPAPMPHLVEGVARGSLTVRVFPPQAQLTARYAGHEKSATGVLSLEEISQGTEVRVRASLAGYESSAKTFQVSKSHGDLQEEIRLSPVPLKKTEYGFITINALPWGKASIVGVVSGKGTPLTERVPVGSYRIFVDGGMGHRASGTVRVKPETTTKCRVDFKKGDGQLSC